MKTERIKWIDNAKAIACLLVICLHIPTSETTKMIINSFVLPLFFFLSGINFNANIDFKQFFNKRIQTLVLPSFALCGVLVIVFESAISYFLNVSYAISFKRIMMGTILQMRGSYEFGAWFLICLFSASIILYNIIKYFIKDDRQILIISIMFFILGCIYSIFIKQVLPWSADVIPFSISYMSLGYYVKKKQLFNKILDNRLFLIYIVAFLSGNIITYLKNVEVNMYLNRIGFPLCAVCTIIGGIGVAIFIGNIIPKNKLMDFWGRNTLTIYCLQYIPIYLIDCLVAKGILIKNVFIYYIFTLVISSLMAMIIEKKLPFLSGKSRNK